jgi:signal transduction histidine kinase
MRPRPAYPIWVSSLAIAAFQVAGSFGAAENQPDRRAVDVAAVALLLLGPAALARRDRWPLAAVAVTIAAADVYVGLGYPFGPVFVSVAVGFFAAIRAGRRRATWALAAAGYAGFVVAIVLDPRPPGISLVHLVLVAGWVAVVLAVAELARTGRERAAAERQRRAGEQRLQLAQELHDVLAHHISLINVQASVALHLLDEQPERARPALVTIKEASREALHELRTALDLLRHGNDAPRSPAPRLTDLPALVEAVRASGLDVQLDRAETPPLPAAVELAAYRIVQEALTNVTRHASARHATVRVGYDDGVTVEVTDDGVGGAAVPGNGIAGMRERAGALGGTVTAGPRPGGGFRVVAHLPDRP